MLLYGASGHAKVIASCLHSNGRTVKAIFDDDPARKTLGNIEVVGPYDPAYEHERAIIVAIGYNDVRRRIVQRIQHPFGRAVHSSALVDPSVKIGEGTVILHRATVQADTTLGRHVIINTAASVDHDCRIADYVHIAPGAILCGNIQVGEGTLVGAGAVVVPNLTIGRGCKIGAGTVVVRDVPDGAVVRGNPGKVVEVVHEW
ncbi:acetyltransferase [Telluribacter sp. SYSU D00476]|uniref:acetyltransferase n=1 Tax=Telluribacter sp. SYSU D00476 TaxID=2811430 RepID=UPI001FF4D0FC|nr:acetyltransferase [Telluribacter sp. SYSU D00476]